MNTEPEIVSLQEVADRLGVHYMTAYRYVRTGTDHSLERYRLPQWA